MIHLEFNLDSIFIFFFNHSLKSYIEFSHIRTHRRFTNCIVATPILLYLTVETSILGICITIVAFLTAQDQTITTNN